MILMKRITAITFLLFGLLTAALATVWPDHPVIHIVTADSVMPTRDIVEAPEGCIGTGITNNDLVAGRMVMTLRGDTLYDSGDYVKGKSGMRIRVRGNSSGAYLPQLPYKIKLTKKADLLRRGNGKFRNKNWALLAFYAWNTAMLNSESNILPMVGPAVCRAVGFDWSPSGEYVSVEINGKYMGMYYLVETVNRGESRVDIEESGFLIENDAYWWNTDYYFKGPHQWYYMGYTMKYPDDDDDESTPREKIEQYMTDFEDSLYEGGSLEQLADYPSFARWVLAHDILGTYDAGGSNMFLYKKDMNPLNPLSSPLCMATPWDFDSSFKMAASEFSRVHDHHAFYYQELFKRQDFMAVYDSIWAAVGKNVYSQVADFLHNYVKEHGESFEDGRKLHRTLFSYQAPNTLEEQVEDVLAHLEKRLDSLGINIEDQVAPVRTVSWQSAATAAYYDLSGRPLATPPSTGIWLERRSDGTVRKKVGGNSQP